MPRIRGTIPPKPTGPSSRFTVGRTSDGYEVVDRDGRPMSEAFDTANHALTLAGELNDAAANGAKALARALERTIIGVYDVVEDDDY